MYMAQNAQRYGLAAPPNFPSNRPSAFVPLMHPVPPMPPMSQLPPPAIPIPMPAASPASAHQVPLRLEKMPEIPSILEDDTGEYKLPSAEDFALLMKADRILKHNMSIIEQGYSRDIMRSERLLQLAQMPHLTDLEKERSILEIKRQDFVSFLVTRTYLQNKHMYRMFIQLLYRLSKREYRNAEAVVEASAAAVPAEAVPAEALAAPVAPVSDKQEADKDPSNIQLPAETSRKRAREVIDVSDEVQPSPSKKATTSSSSSSGTSVTCYPLFANSVLAVTLKTGTINLPMWEGDPDMFIKPDTSTVNMAIIPSGLSISEIQEKEDGTESDFVLIGSKMGIPIVRQKSMKYHARRLSILLGYDPYNDAYVFNVSANTSFAPVYYSSKFMTYRKQLMMIANYGKLESSVMGIIINSVHKAIGSNQTIASSCAKSGLEYIVHKTHMHTIEEIKKIMFDVVFTCLCAMKQRFVLEKYITIDT
jgi:hypothetical protein